jgi:hypothetical protein
MKKKYVLYAIVFILILVQININAQQSNKVVILSKRVGLSVEKSERDYFHIFGGLKDFKCAVVYLSPSGKYFVKFTSQKQGSVEKDTTIFYSEISILNLAEKIDHFEEIADGTYTMGETTPILSTEEVDSISQVKNVAKDILSQVKNIVGDTIDIDERKFYGLFPQISDFNKAIIQQNSESSLDFRIFYEQGNLLKDSIYKSFYSTGDLLKMLDSAEEKRELEAKEFKKGPATLLLRTGEIVAGEILSIQSNELHFNEQAHKIEAKEKLNSDRLINKDEIRKIIIRGESNALLGAGIGLLGGVTVGSMIGAIIVGYSKYNWSNSILSEGFIVACSCSISGILGTLIGAIIGDSNPQEDKIFTIDKYTDLSEVNEYIR